MKNICLVIEQIYAILFGIPERTDEITVKLEVSNNPKHHGFYFSKVVSTVNVELFDSNSASEYWDEKIATLGEPMASVMRNLKRLTQTTKIYVYCKGLSIFLKDGIAWSDVLPVVTGHITTALQKYDIQVQFRPYTKWNRIWDHWCDREPHG